MKSRFFTLVLFAVVSSIGNGQPLNSFFVVHCDPNEPYNFPNLEKLVDTANVYNIELTIEFTAPWIDSILPFQTRLNKLIIWQSQGHEIGMHHHEVTANGVWDGFSNLSMIEIHNAGRDTNDFIGNMDSLYSFIQQISATPILTIGTEDSTQMPWQALYQTKGHTLSDGFSNPLSYSYNSQQYSQTSHCFISNYFKEQQLENQYPFMTAYSVLGANCHVHNFVSDPLSIISFFQFINLNGISSRTVSDILEGCCTSSVENQTGHTRIAKLFPNPVANELFVSIDESNTIRKIRIYNSIGLEITILPGLSNVYRIDTENWQSGIYFILVEMDNRKTTTQSIVRI